MRISKKNLLIYSLLVIISLIVLYPFFFMIMNSFKTGSEIINAPNALPKNFSFNGYIQAFYSLNLGRIFLNTLFISVTVTFVNTLLSAMVAYAIVKMNLPGREFWIKLILTSMMVPAVLFTIPTYMMLYSWGWVNTFQALIVPGTISAYNIFLLVQFLKQVDNAYLEAARIDGAGEFTIFFKVVLPMIRPALATVAILTFMGSWNDFMGPLLYVRDDSLMTLQLALFKFVNDIPTDNLEQLWAMTTMIAVPVVLVFFFLQRNFIKAFTGIGVK
ncbi:putative permease [Yersinia pseudotuberculosis]|uniref:Putative permease n=1 Tax=Yersinia similis TaxID=367190 RepID=A0A0T9RCA2_9GAMM|nr:MULTISPECIES: carbohydrate ABC transporter permease [Yersinia pseudotuberculosis complex]AHK18693.1 sugar ABC transporter permease [Yersinia similis]CFQ68753.1 putative permease [Yersinia similis]CNB84214.1 putative permease [Yersinia similis]CNF36167.1 putative permease [Yersinia similis]CNG38377.1 putative permease [Yersinia similis]